LASVINTYTKSGRKVAFRPGRTPSPLGTLDPTTGRVYQRPRLTANDLSGRSVVVTNPRASLNASRNERSASLGQGGVLQRGRNRDIPGQTG